jgi:hypothetical protein
LAKTHPSPTPIDKFNAIMLRNLGYGTCVWKDVRAVTTFHNELILRSSCKERMLGFRTQEITLLR